MNTQYSKHLKYDSMWIILITGKTSKLCSQSHLTAFFKVLFYFLSYNVSWCSEMQFISSLEIFKTKSSRNEFLFVSLVRVYIPFFDCWGGLEGMVLRWGMKNTLPHYSLIFKGQMKISIISNKFNVL